MKGKGKFFFGLLIGIVVGVLSTIGVYFLTIGEVAWKEYLENSLIPNIVLALTSISTILFAAMPIINRVSSALNMFKSATKDVNDTIVNNDKNEQRIAELEKSLGNIKTATNNTEKIVRLAFCNTDELVKKGFAKEIAKVGKDEDAKKIEN